MKEGSIMKLFSSESVTPGHPDKIADLISDSILDAYLLKDPNTRAAIETCLKDNVIFIFGEVSTHVEVDIEAIVKETIKKIGYDKKELGFWYDDIIINYQISQQSPDIALGVDETDNKEQGAGDQGLMFGYANNDTKEFMPLPIYLAHLLSKRLVEVRRKNIIKGLRPDGKVQVTVAYDNKVAQYVSAVVVSTQHDEELSLDFIRQEIKKHVIKAIIPHGLLNENTKYYINPTGRFVIGGPVGDAGLTGRKIIVDTYGGYARHGGGAFSGKDASKVDRSASYMARYIAKQIVAANIAKECEVQIAYAIGVAQPVSVYVDTFGTSKVDEILIMNTILATFDLRPKAITEFLQLKKPIFTQSTNFGHFGKPNLTWEKLDHVKIFADLVV